MSKNSRGRAGGREAPSVTGSRRNLQAGAAAGPPEADLDAPRRPAALARVKEAAARRRVVLAGGGPVEPGRRGAVGMAETGAAATARRAPEPAVFPEPEEGTARRLARGLRGAAAADAAAPAQGAAGAPRRGLRRIAAGTLALACLSAAIAAGALLTSGREPASSGVVAPLPAALAGTPGAAGDAVGPLRPVLPGPRIASAPAAAGAPPRDALPAPLPSLPVLAAEADGAASPPTRPNGDAAPGDLSSRRLSGPTPFAAPRAPPLPDREAAPAPPLLAAAPGGRSDGGTDDAAAADGAGAAEREAALLPDRVARLDLQLRLRLAGEAPGALDGVLGPRTRAALRAWQAERGHHESGRINAATLAALRAETDAEAAVWWARERLRARTARSPSPRPGREGPMTGCARDADGVVITGRSVRCDIVYLREDLAALFR